MNQTINWKIRLFHTKSSFYWLWTGTLFFGLAARFLVLRGTVEAEQVSLLTVCIGMLCVSGTIAYVMAHKVRHEFDKVRVSKWHRERYTEE
jgi:hypothetical protein